MSCGIHALTIPEYVCMLPIDATSMGGGGEVVGKQRIQRTQHILKA